MGVVLVVDGLVLVLLDEVVGIPVGCEASSLCSSCGKRFEKISMSIEMSSG